MCFLFENYICVIKSIRSFVNSLMRLTRNTPRQRVTKLRQRVTKPRQRVTKLLTARNHVVNPRIHVKTKLTARHKATTARHIPRSRGLGSQPQKPIHICVIRSSWDPRQQTKKSMVSQFPSATAKDLVTKKGRHGITSYRTVWAIHRGVGNRSA